MYSDVFDLSIARITKPVVSQVSKQRGVSRAQIVRCDSAASIHIDGDSAEPIPAVPGLLIDNFTSLYISNVAGGGRLVIAFYDDVYIGSPQDFACDVPLGGSFPAANTAATVSIAPPTETFSIRVGAIAYGYDAAPAAAVVVLRLVSPTGVTETLFSDYKSALGGELKSFARPIVAPQGYSVTLQAGAGGAAVTGYAKVFGNIVR